MSVIKFPTKFKPKETKEPELSFEEGLKLHARGLAALSVYRQTFDNLETIQDLDKLKFAANSEAMLFQDTGEFKSRSVRACIWLWGVTADEVGEYRKKPLVDHAQRTEKKRKKKLEEPEELPELDAGTGRTFIIGAVLTAFLLSIVLCACSIVAHIVK